MNTSEQSPISVSPAQLTVLVVCLVSVYFVFGFYGKSLDAYRISQRAAAIRREVSRLEEQNTALQERVAFLATEAYVEMAARDKLSLVKPGDRSLVIMPEADVARVEGPPPAAEPARPFPELGHVAEWLALFFGTH